MSLRFTPIRRTIAVLECDPNRHLANWVHKLNRPQLRTYAPVTLDNFYELYDKARDKARAQSDVVLLDLPGTETIVTTYATSTAELVVVPLRASPMEAVMTLKGVRLVRQQARVCRCSIPCVAVLTRARPEGRVTTQRTPSLGAAGGQLKCLSWPGRSVSWSGRSIGRSLR